MKTLYLFTALALLGTASPAKAVESMTLGRVCERLGRTTETVACLQAAEGRSVDGLAAWVCNRLSGAVDTIECVGAVAGREYAREEVLVCDNLSDARSTIDCLASMGRPMFGTGVDGELQRTVLGCRARNRYDREILSCIELRVGLVGCRDRPMEGAREGDVKGK